MLDTGEVDLAVGVPPTNPAGRILTRPLFQERFVCIVRKGHAAAGAPLDLQTFLGLSHLLVSPENERFGHVDAALAKQGLKRRLALTLPQMYAAPTLIARSDMISTVMGGVVAASGHADGLCVLAPPLDLEPVPFVMVWHKRNDTHPAQRWFRDCIASLSVALPGDPSDVMPATARMGASGRAEPSAPPGNRPRRGHRGLRPTRDANTPTP